MIMWESITEGGSSYFHIKCNLNFSLPKGRFYLVFNLDHNNYYFICYRPKRQRKLKFVGRRILHTWEVSTDTENPTYKTYAGNVLSVVSGEDGKQDAVYSIHYDIEDATYDIHDLIKDYNEGNPKFHDL